MGVPIPEDVERRIRKLLGKDRGLREIAREVGVAHDTVRRVRDRRVERPEPFEGIDFREVEPEVCDECSRLAGREVKVRYRPCVACTCRRLARDRHQVASTPDADSGNVLDCSAVNHDGLVPAHVLV